MSGTRVIRIALGFVGAIVCSCSTAALTDPAAVITGVYSLEPVAGQGPAWGTLILTRQGYAERRVRFLEADSTLSDEYLSRGTAEFRPDSTISLTLKDIDPPAELPWTPDARLTPDGVVISHVVNGLTLVETYRRQ